MTDPITMKIWQLVVAVLSSGAVSGFGAVVTLQTAQAVNSRAIERNAHDIQLMQHDLKRSIERLQEATISLSQQVARLEAVK